MTSVAGLHFRWQRWNLGKSDRRGRSKLSVMGAEALLHIPRTTTTAGEGGVCGDGGDKSDPGSRLSVSLQASPKRYSG
jgi:hypothetical protein